MHAVILFTILASRAHDHSLSAWQNGSVSSPKPFKQEFFETDAVLTSSYDDSLATPL